MTKLKKDVCAQCGKAIEQTKKSGGTIIWIHSDYTPRHIATPTKKPEGAR